jgi:hypothetical protein
VPHPRLCQRFDPPLDLEAYDYLVWRVRELPPMDLVSQLPPDDPRLRRMQRQDTMRGSDERAAASSSTFGAADEDEPAEQKYERLQYLFVNDARKSESDGASAPPTPSSAATGSSSPPPPPPLASTIARSLTIMSSLLSVPLPLSHAAHPFLRPDEALYRYTPGSSIFASLAPAGLPASPTVGAGSAAAPGDLCMHTSAADPNAGDANQRASAANPFDPNLPSNHWLYDGREVCLTVETASPDGFEQVLPLHIVAVARPPSYSSWYANILICHHFPFVFFCALQNFRRLFNSKDADASGTSDPVQVHAHPALLPAPELLLRSRVENTDVAMMHAPHARSALFQREDDDAPAAAASSASASASASSTSTSTSTSAASSAASSADAAPLPSDGMRVPGRPFVNLIVPLRPERRESWPNVSSPQRPWRALLAAALPTTAQGAPIFPDQVCLLAQCRFTHRCIVCVCVPLHVFHISPNAVFFILFGRLDIWNSRTTWRRPRSHEWVSPFRIRSPDRLRSRLNRFTLSGARSRSLSGHASGHCRLFAKVYAI